ncbi:exported hypothetical protein [Gammaproteobacteria bacterium]
MKMKKNNTTKKLVFLLPALFFAGNEMIFANSDSSSKDNSSASSVVSKESVAGKKKTCELCEHIKVEPAAATKEITIEASGNNYQPYVQVGGTRFFNVHESKAAATADLFIPLWQNGLTDLIFTDLRVNDRSGTPFEGNIHLGYRHLFSESQQSIGLYGAFDRKKTQFGNYFNQFTFGGEYWIQDWFVGANYYQPIGNTEKLIDRVIIDITPLVADQAIMGVNLTSEKAMPGVDAEVGYEFTEGLVGYVGGYYFGANNAATVYGPRARLAYDWSLSNGRRILGIFDKVGLEAGIQRDKPRGVTGYLSVNVRIGWLFDKKAALQGISRHMIDPVRRDIDIVSGSVTKKELKALSFEDMLNREFEKDPGYIAAAPTVKAELDERVDSAIKAMPEDKLLNLDIDKTSYHPSVKAGIRVHREHVLNRTNHNGFEYYKKTYLWLNDPVYSSVNANAIIELGASFEKLSKDYNSGNIVNFSAVKDILIKIPKSDTRFAGIKKDVFQIMKDINSIKGKANEFAKNQSINGGMGGSIISNMNKLGLFGGGCTTKLLTDLVNNSNTKIK